MFKSVDIKELKKLIGNIDIIDIRDPDEYNDGHIPTSINIPNDKIMINPEYYLNKSKQYYIYCQYGKTSIKTCIYLNKVGYNVINLIGGYQKYT